MSEGDGKYEDEDARFARAYRPEAHTVIDKTVLQAVVEGADMDKAAEVARLARECVDAVLDDIINDDAEPSP